MQRPQLPHTVILMANPTQLGISRFRSAARGVAASGLGLFETHGDIVVTVIHTLETSLCAALATPGPHPVLVVGWCWYPLADLKRTTQEPLV